MAETRQQPDDQVFDIEQRGIQLVPQRQPPRQTRRLVVDLARH